MKRLFDVFAALVGIILLFPFLFIIGVLIKITSKGSVFFVQERIGQHEKIFKLFKFRSMTTNQNLNASLITIGNNDPRITKIGHYLRKYKLDELPQLFNVFFGEMSLVGPRPEVIKYVNLYNNRQKEVLNFKPGITDMASIVYKNENEILSKQAFPEKYYINNIMPDKIELNLKYAKESQSLRGSLHIIFKTFKAILDKN
jgi:lipopolysaccharide/colanic/teichoic acid biosynthesis glycosyltransferase